MYHQIHNPHPIHYEMLMITAYIAAPTAKLFYLFCMYRMLVLVAASQAGFASSMIDDVNDLLVVQQTLHHFKILYVKDTYWL